MAVGWRDGHGDVRLDHTVPLARSGAVQGALTGGVVGQFLLAPLLGAAVGGAAGAMGDKLSQLGLDQLVVNDILKALEPGRPALFLLSDHADADRVAEALPPQHPTVIKTTLPEVGGSGPAPRAPRRRLKCVDRWLHRGRRSDAQRPSVGRAALVTRHFP